MNLKREIFLKHFKNLSSQLHQNKNFFSSKYKIQMPTRKTFKFRIKFCSNFYLRHKKKLKNKNYLEFLSKFFNFTKEKQKILRTSKILMPLEKKFQKQKSTENF